MVPSGEGRVPGTFADGVGEAQAVMRCGMLGLYKHLRYPCYSMWSALYNIARLNYGYSLYGVLYDTK